VTEDPHKVVDLHPSEWHRENEQPVREPFFGARWWVIPAYFILVAGLTAIGAKGGPWAMLIVRSL
jgi:hypothetical protein